MTLHQILESPTYLVMRERNSEASSGLKWLRGPQYDPSEEIAELQNDNEEQKANNLSAIEALTRPTSVRGLIICFGLMFFQQVSGINAVIFYTTDIFEAAGTGIDPEIATIIVGVMQVVATFVASLVVDRLGRRILLLISDSVMALCTMLLGLYFFLKGRDPESVASLGWLPIVALCVFIVTFSLGFGPVP
jgi:Na+/melibiose symporter-like transporter